MAGERTEMLDVAYQLAHVHHADGMQGQRVQTAVHQIPIRDLYTGKTSGMAALANSACSNSPLDRTVSASLSKSVERERRALNAMDGQCLS
ncbi:hypothetical protein D3C77_175820 [compost metagenome]|uniref:Uncharacterized protein n=1 Tax=Pseudomonas fluorescens TaxID=294 RepID=A0A5E6X3U9_PSEFL|nr:hypothetical protein PS652_05111 [Pseudomonas fluorescens]